MSGRNPATIWWKLVRFGFSLLYNEMAWTYDLVSWLVSLGNWRHWQQVGLEYLPVGSQGQILELAFGTGNLQLEMAARGFSSVGIDLSGYMSRIAARKLRRQGVPLRLARAASQHLPFRSVGFDALIATFPTEFIINSSTLSECKRVLAYGGVLIVVPNGVLTSKSVVSTAIEWAYRVTGQRGAWETEMLATLEEAGFEAALIEKGLHMSKVWLVVARKQVEPGSGDM